MDARIARLVVVITLASACRHAPAGQDLSRCFQTGELGNYGCAEVHGRVMDTLGRPVAEAMILAAAPPTARHDVSGLAARTDSSGWYAARLVRYTEPTLLPDTATVQVRAVYARRPPDGPPRAETSLADTLWQRGDTGSAVAIVYFSPVGARPVRAEVSTIIVHRGLRLGRTR